jgi:predicted DNA binding CopG/RHH family protein
MQDLSSLDFSQFKPMRFEIAPKQAALTMRLPPALLNALKAKAKGVPYRNQRFGHGCNGHAR